jgi:hypothetical protein
MELTVQVEFAQLVEAIKKLSPAERSSIRYVLDTNEAKPPQQERQFGTMKGLITHIADDFDEPLDDFKEYM